MKILMFNRPAFLLPHNLFYTALELVLNIGTENIGTETGTLMADDSSVMSQTKF